MAALKWVLLAIAAGYLGLVALMYFAQRKLMYFPETLHVAPAEAGLPEAEEVSLQSGDERIIVWHVPPRADRPVVIYFQGNGGALRHRVGRFRPLVADGFGLIAVSYRGYGGSSGWPSEEGLHADGRAAYAFAQERYRAQRIAVWGESIGTGVAVRLAAEQEIAKLILESSFSSAVDIAALAYPFAPASLLMKDQFRSDQYIGRVRAPVLFMHGVEDDIVPIILAERLFALAKAPKRFVRFARGNHNDLDDFGALEEAKAFLSSER